MSTTPESRETLLRSHPARAAQPLMDFSSEIPAEGRWFVLHTRSRQEKSLSDELRIMQIGHYLPLARQVRMYGKRKARVELPLFPGYLFLRGTVEDAYAANRTHRVARIIQVPDQEHLNWELSNLRMALESQAPIDSYPFLDKGVRVEVRSGPLTGLQGFVESRLGGGRLILQVDILGQAVSLEVAGAQLDAV